MSYTVQRIPVAFWGFGEDTPAATDPFFDMKDGVRFWNDSSRKDLLDALASMSILPQMPAVDAQGVRLLVTPGATPGIISTKDSVIAMARAGNTVLALDAFEANVTQVLRLVTDLSALPALTDPAKGGNYAVLLTPDQAAALAPWAPAPGPAAPVLPPPVARPAPVSPAAATPPGAPATTPAAPSAATMQAGVTKLGDFIKKPAVWITGLVLVGIYALKGK